MTADDYWADVDRRWQQQRRRPASGPPSARPGGVRGSAFAAAVLLGLQDALEHRRRDEPVIEQEADEPVPPAGSVVVHFDASSPRRTVAVLPDR